MADKRPRTSRLGSTAQALFIRGSAVGIFCNVLFASVATYGIGLTSRAFVLAVPSVAYAILAICAWKSNESSSVALAAILSVVPVIAVPLILFAIGIFGGVNPYAFSVLTSPIFAGLVLLIGLLAAIAGSEKRSQVLSTAVFSSVAGLAFWGGMYQVFAAERPSTSQDQQQKADALGFHLVLCNYEYRQKTGHPAARIEDLGPKGSKCLSKSEITGSAAGADVEYQLVKDLPGGYLLTLSLPASQQRFLFNEGQDLLIPDLNQIREYAECHSKELKAGVALKLASCHPMLWKSAGKDSFTSFYDKYLIHVSADGDLALVEARPRIYGSTGFRSFRTDKDFRVHYTLENRSATDGDPVLLLQ